MSKKTSLLNDWLKAREVSKDKDFINFNKVGIRTSEEVLTDGEYQERMDALYESSEEQVFDTCSITTPTNMKRQRLYNTVINFMKNQDVTCVEDIHQTDRVIDNAYDLLEELFSIVKDDLNLDLKEDD